MTTRSKSVLVLGATLLVGILIGALAVGAVVNHRVAEFEALRRPGGFGQVVEDVVRPTDDAQRQAIRQILDRAAERNVELREYVRRQHFMVLDSLRTDLKDVLTPAQQERLRTWVRDQRRVPDPGRHGFGFGRRRGGPARGPAPDSLP